MEAMEEFKKAKAAADKALADALDKVGGGGGAKLDPAA